MNHSNGQSIGSAIREFLHAFKLEDKFNEKKLVSSWGKVMGKMIELHTKELSVRNRVLFVKVDSAALRNELSFARERIVKLMNEAAGDSIIDEIVVK